MTRGVSTGRGLQGVPLLLLLLLLLRDVQAPLSRPQFTGNFGLEDGAQTSVSAAGVLVRSLVLVDGLWAKF